jgi:ABC-type thiamine transport system substrate-binding protein
MIRFGFRSISCFFFIFLSSFSGICSESKCELVVYTYDSLMAPEGLGPALFSLFEK